MLDRRLHVRIDHALWERLAREAARRTVSVSVLVREAIDERYPGSTEKRRAALAAVINAPPMAVPTPAALRREREKARVG
jgi:Ribbon-helix-helix protein, copG family